MVKTADGMSVAMQITLEALALVNTWRRLVIYAANRRPATGMLDIRTQDELQVGTSLYTLGVCFIGIVFVSACGCAVVQQTMVYQMGVGLQPE